MLEEYRIKERWIEHEGRQVGFMLPHDNITDRPEKVFITQRKKMFEFPRGSKRYGFSISIEVFKKLSKAGVRTIRVVLNKKNGCTAVYITTRERWLREGEKNLYGFTDQQLFLPIEKFDTRGE